MFVRTLKLSGMKEALQAFAEHGPSGQMDSEPAATATLESLKACNTCAFVYVFRPVYNGITLLQMGDMSPISTC